MAKESPKGNLFHTGSGACGFVPQDLLTPDCTACIPREGILHAVKSLSNRLHCMHSAEREILKFKEFARRSSAMIVRRLGWKENFGLMEKHEARFKVDDSPADYLHCESGTTNERMASGRADDKDGEKTRISTERRRSNCHLY